MKKWLCLLAGGYHQDIDTGRWHTCGQTEGDDHGVTWDRLRVEAAAVLYHRGDFTKIVTSGGVGQLKYFNDPNIPTVGAVAYQELLELGVPGNDLAIEDKGSDNTWRQLKNILHLIKEGSVEIEGLALLSQQFHIGRIWAIIKHHPDLAKVFECTRIISAEDVLLGHDRGFWEQSLQNFFSSEAYQARLCREYNGIRQIAQGTYQFR